jgi:hypothetical protein
MTNSELSQNVVYVYYFHPKQPCPVWTAAGVITQKTVETAFAGNSNVAFVDIDFSEYADKPLLEKYEVTKSKLIIAKGDDAVNIFQQAYDTAIANPQALENLIKEEVNKRL